MRQRFAKALEAHNAKNAKKHKDRCYANIDDYIEEYLPPPKDGKPPKKRKDMAQEVIFQLGTAEEYQKLVELVGAEKALEIHKGFAERAIEWWQEMNPQYEPFSAVFHQDESIPHTHLDFLPIGDESNLKKQGVSVKAALRKMGFTADNSYQQRSDFMYTRWREFEEMAQEYCDRVAPNIFHIVHSEPCMRQHQETPEWRLQQAEKDKRAELERLNTEIAEKTVLLMNIPPQPQLPKPLPPDEPRPMREHRAYTREEEKELAKEQKEWDKSHRKGGERWNAEQQHQAATEQALKDQANWREKYGSTQAIQAALQNLNEQRKQLTEREQKVSLLEKGYSSALDVAKKEKAAAEQQAAAATQKAKLADLVNRINKHTAELLCKPLDTRSAQQLAQAQMVQHQKGVQNEQHNEQYSRG